MAAGESKSNLVCEQFATQSSPQQQHTCVEREISSLAAKRSRQTSQPRHVRARIRTFIALHARGPATPALFLLHLCMLPPQAHSCALRLHPLHDHYNLRTHRTVPSHQAACLLCLGNLLGFSSSFSFSIQCALQVLPSSAGVALLFIVSCAAVPTVSTTPVRTRVCVHFAPVDARM